MEIETGLFAVLSVRISRRKTLLSGGKNKTNFHLTVYLPKKNWINLKTFGKIFNGTKGQKCNFLGAVFISIISGVNLT